MAVCSPPQCQFTIEDVFRNATIIHTADMTQPSRSASSKQSVHTGKTSTRHDISVGYFVQPGYVQDTADVSQVECVEPSLLPGIVHVSLPYSNVLIIRQCGPPYLSSQPDWGLSSLETCDKRELQLPSQSSCRSLRPMRGCQ